MRARHLTLVAAATLVASVGEGCSCGNADTGSGGKGGGASTQGAGGGTCAIGQELRCDGDVAVGCDDAANRTDCKAAGKSCVEPYGCVACVPGGGTCKDGHATACKADGSAMISFECDPVQGMKCTDGGCTGTCSPGELGPSYIGCDYWPTMTLNPVWKGFDFAVGVANASDKPAKVTITKGATSVKTQTIAAHDLAIISLPWVTELKGGDVDACQLPPEPGKTRVVKDGAYRVRADAPITVYQFSPLAYQIDPAPADCPVGTKCPGGQDPSCNSYSNDASLLLPATAVTGNYSGLTWPAGPLRAGFLAVTATADGTTVKVTGSGDFAAGDGVDAKGDGTIKLDAGDVLELVSTHPESLTDYGSDISGTRIRADKPVQVIAGHSCANVPTASTGFCDHLEEGLFPDETLGADYLVTYPGAIGGDSPHVISVLATVANTKVHFDPAIAPDQTLGPDDPPLVIDGVDKDVRVTADQPILVGQLMQGSSSVPSGQGDPSLSLAIPTQQFRSQYTFVASTSYDANFVNVIAPDGAAVTVDDKVVPSAEFTKIGKSGFSVARHQLGATDVHTASSTKGFGIVVYGYGKDTSYMYPGGLDLKAISPPPPK